MNLRLIKISVKIALITALVILGGAVADQLLVYKYFKITYYLPVAVLAALFSGFVLARRIQSPGASHQNLLMKLTTKEMEIMVLIAEGKSNKEIAALNFVELSTIKTHINNIYTKLGVNNRRQAIDVYIKNSSVHKSTLSPPRLI